MYVRTYDCVFQIPGKFKLKGHDHVHCTELYESLNAEGDSQFLPSQKKDSTYVSRLQVYTYVHTYLRMYVVFMYVCTYVRVTYTQLIVLCCMHT